VKVLFAEYLTWHTPNRVGSHYYARHFLQLGWEVGWLGGEFHVWNLVGNRPELRRKYPIWRAGGIRHDDGVWEYTPFKLLPFRDLGPLGAAELAWKGSRLCMPPIRSVLARSGFLQADLLWISNPQAYPWLAREPGYDRFVYRAADNHAVREGIPALVAGIENEIAKRADAVLVVPPDSLDRLSQAAPGRTHYMPNGVDLARFAGEHPKPPEYEDLQGPIAVYVGSINYWFDVVLLSAVAAARPDIAFVLIGEPLIEIGPLRELGNVRILGARLPEEIPGYLKHADVGLLPFRDTPSTHNIRSLKLYEYAACGLPSIHSSVTAEYARSLPVLRATDSASFSQALDRALEWGPSERESALRFAAANSWEERFTRVDALMEGWW